MVQEADRQDDAPGEGRAPRPQKADADNTVEHDWHEMDNPAHGEYQPPVFIQTRREETRRLVVLALVVQQTFLALIVLLTILLSGSGSLNAQVLLAIITASAAATMVALRWYFH